MLPKCLWRGIKKRVHNYELNGAILALMIMWEKDSIGGRRWVINPNLVSFLNLKFAGNVLLHLPPSTKALSVVALCHRNSLPQQAGLTFSLVCFQCLVRMELFRQVFNLIS